MTTSRPEILVRKLNLAGEQVFTYSGEVVYRTPTSVVVQAVFSRYDRLELGYAVFERGDRFVEYFYSDRWYNAFEVHTASGDRLKGWYCNITRPALIGEAAVSSVDLALDVWVQPDGTIQVLDQDEFAAQPLSAEEAASARAAVDEIRRLVREGEGPFRRTVEGQSARPVT